MYAIWLLLGLLLLLVARGVVEAARHRRNLERIPIRIHVNGTRGKSSVTRLIAAALREAGIVTVAKTTGTLPRLILPDGSEQPIDRPGKANVLEQVEIARAAALFDPEALVVECMALQPQLQSLSESKLVRATHGVITNARADHLDVMGPSEVDVAAALTNMTPVRGKLFTAETKHLGVIRSAAADRKTRVIHVGDEEVAAVTDAELAGFRYVEHAENVALALRLCADLGIDRAVALRGMAACPPDPGASTTHELSFCGRRLVFVNAFAANDPDSSSRIWQRSLEQFSDVARRIVVVNCRADRPDRSWQLGEAAIDWPTADSFVLMGTGTQVFDRAARQAGLDPQKLVTLDDDDPAELFETVLALADRSALVVGIGNIGGHGLDVIRYFRNHSLLEPAPASESPRTSSPSRLREFAVATASRDLTEPMNGHRWEHLT